MHMSDLSLSFNFKPGKYHALWNDFHKRLRCCGHSSQYFIIPTSGRTRGRVFYVAYDSYKLPYVLRLDITDSVSNLQIVNSSLFDDGGGVERYVPIPAYQIVCTIAEHDKDSVFTIIVKRGTNSEVAFMKLGDDLLCKSIPIPYGSRVYLPAFCDLDNRRYDVPGYLVCRKFVPNRDDKIILQTIIDPEALKHMFKFTVYNSALSSGTGKDADHILSYNFDTQSLMLTALRHFGSATCSIPTHEDYVTIDTALLKYTDTQTAYHTWIPPNVVFHTLFASASERAYFYIVYVGKRRYMAALFVGQSAFTWPLTPPSEDVIKLIDFDAVETLSSRDELIGINPSCDEMINQYATRNAPYAVLSLEPINVGDVSDVGDLRCVLYTSSKVKLGVLCNVMNPVTHRENTSYVLRAGDMMRFLASLREAAFVDSDVVVSLALNESDRELMLVCEATDGSYFSATYPIKFILNRTLSNSDSDSDSVLPAEESV
jgi:hypothetical protein